MKRLLRRITGPSEKEIEAILEELMKKGLVEIHGFDHEEPMYRLTEKGLEEQRKKRGRRP